MDWFLRSLLSPIGKDVASHFPQTEEDALQMALKYDLIYAQTGYDPTVLPDLPRPSDAHTPGAPHATGSIVGSISHPSAQPLMSYGFPGGGGTTSCTSTPPGRTHLGYGMPHPFAQPPAYLNVSQPNHYPYPQPGAPAPPAYALPPPLPPQPQQQHL